MTKKIKKIIFVVLICTLFISNCNFITVNAASKSKPKFDKTKITLKVGDHPYTLAIWGIGLSDVKNIKSIKSKNSKIAKVKKKKYGDLVITPISAGKTIVSCKINKTVLKCTVIVKDVTKNEILKYPKIYTEDNLNHIIVGREVSFKFGEEGDNKWSSSDESIAVVDALGNVTFLKEGSVIISVSYTSYRSKITYTDNITINVFPCFIAYNEKNLNLIKQRLVEWEKKWPTNSLWGQNDIYTTKLDYSGSNEFEDFFFAYYGGTISACDAFATMTLEYLSDYKCFYKTYYGAKEYNYDGREFCLEYDAINQDWVDKEGHHHKVKIGDKIVIENRAIDGFSHAVIVTDISNDQKIATCVSGNNIDENNIGHVIWNQTFDLTTQEYHLISMTSFWEQ